MCSEGYCSCPVCLPVTQHLTSRAMNHSTKIPGGYYIGRKLVGFSLKMLRSGVTAREVRRGFALQCFLIFFN